MKMVIRSLVFLSLILPAVAGADPFWCDSGADRVESHPLRLEALRSDLDALPSEVGQIAAVQRRLNAHVSLLARQADLASVDVFNKMVEAVLDPNGPRFLSTSMFRFVHLFGFGVEKADCDSTADEIRTDRPVLYAIYEAADTIKLIGRESSLTDQEEVAKQITASYTAYDAWLLTNGLPQWPWELWLNGKAVDSDIRTPPPLCQWIFARPSAGIDLSHPSQGNADAVPAFGVEVVGLIKYRDRTYKKHFGASLLATIGSEDGAGYGLALRWNGFWAGYVFREGDRADAVYVGLDLYQVLQDDNKRTQFVDDFAEEVIPVFKDLASGRN